MSILINSINKSNTLDWENLKDKTTFKESNPNDKLQYELNNIVAPKRPREPKKSRYFPKLTFFDKLIKSRKRKKIQISEQKYNVAIEKWKNKILIIEKEIEQQEIEKEKIKKHTAKKVINWKKRKEQFKNKKEKYNLKIDKLKIKYLNCEQEAIVFYCEQVLKNSEYPSDFPKKYELEYNPKSKILVIEYSLPTIENIPKLKEVKFIRNELKEYYISDAQTRKLYDDTMYKIALRTIHEIFENDIVNAIEFISYNGWVNAINKATGKRENNCILSIQVNKTEFRTVDLSRVDPKTCFKNFKGIASSKLSSLTPIQPILKISRTDKRFTDHYEVVEGIDNSTNLAAMDWEDFEHLIREIFENEFSSNGGEVKVTQASRDGGVDAIAFDPDPIRGGKIVIQAKRYTNTVGVSAIRDLYGTVMNEGATKGILVTTADYGPDAYGFAKGKPLTLMNGSNLLFLLEKHGYKARINIKEAKKLLKKE